MVTLILTNEEAKLVKDIIMTTEIKGNMTNLTTVLTVMADIIRRLDTQDEEKPDDN